jgi:hypothetical protein
MVAGVIFDARHLLWQSLMPIPLKTSGWLVVYLPEKADACSPGPAQPEKIEKGGAGWH